MTDKILAAVDIGSSKVATIVGVKIFDADATTLTRHIRQTEDKLALLPKSVRKKVTVADDDF